VLRSPIPMARRDQRRLVEFKSKRCETLVRGPLAAEFYYVYAMDEHGGEWKGKAFMCTRDREFRYHRPGRCFVREL